MRHLVFALFVVLVPLTARADDWPQFRGPDRTGVSKETGLLKAWPKEGLKPAWTYKNAGLGFSTVAVAKGVVYTLGTDMNFKDELVIALDEKSGKELWTATIAPIYTYKGNSYGDGPRSTPTVDGDLLFALGGQGELVCVDVTKKGAVVWRKDLIKDLGSVIMDKYGYSESPLVDGDQLICTPGGKGGAMTALDKKTGKVLWRSKGWTDLAPYSSAVVADIHGVRQYIQAGYINGIKGGVLAGVEAKTGNQLWVKSIFTDQGSEGISPTPIVKDNLVYMTSGFGAGCRLFEINNKQQATDKYTKAATKKMKNTHGGVVVIGDHVYGHTEPKFWACQELLTGSVTWTEGAGKSGSITAAEGLLYLYSEDGEASLVEANPQAFKLISSFTIPEKSPIPGPNGNRLTSRQARTWAHPVIANGKLYLRDHELIFAFKITK